MTPSWWNSTAALDRINTWTQVATVVFGLLAASATALKIIAANRLSALQSSRAAELHSRLSKAEADTKAVRTSLDEARTALDRSTASLQDKVAEAQAAAEAERVARLRIEERLADRTLQDAQIRAIASRLTPFKGQEFEITTYWELKEAMAFANQVFAALGLAEWKYIQPEGGRVLLGGVAGVLVYVHPEANERTQQAARALVSALAQQRVAADLKQYKLLHPERLDINIGTKP